MGNGTTEGKLESISRTNSCFVWSTSSNKSIFWRLAKRRKYRRKKLDNYTGSDIAARGQYYGQAIAERATNLEEFQQLLLSAPKANRQGMEFLTNACWDSLRSIWGTCWIWRWCLIGRSSCLDSFHFHRVRRRWLLWPTKKIEKVPFKHLFQEAPCTAVFCDKGLPRRNYVLMVMKHLEEFPVPKIRTLSRFLSGGLAASCGVGSLEEAKMVPVHPVPWLWDVRKVTRSWRQGMAGKWIWLHLRKGDVYCTDETCVTCCLVVVFPLHEVTTQRQRKLWEFSNQIPNRCNLDLRLVARQSLQRGLAQRWQGEQWTVKPGCWGYILWRIHRNWYILPTWVVDFSR